VRVGAAAVLIRWTDAGRVETQVRILPLASASTELQDAVTAVLKREDVLMQIPKHRDVFVWIDRHVPAGSTLEEAHAIWRAPHLDRLSTPGKLSRQPLHATCPNGIVRVFVESVKRRTGGMSSYYGFEGYFVSLLLLLDEQTVWDARGEIAS